jgi:hypothetical protein
MIVVPYYSASGKRATNGVPYFTTSEKKNSCFGWLNKSVKGGT